MKSISSSQASPAVARTAPARDPRHADFLSRRQFGSLDGLRALSILAVIWLHARGPAFGWSLLARGAEGVTLFFVISGFLITTLLLRERETFGSISLKQFYARRTLRIFPLYFGVLALFCLVGLWRGVHSDFGERFFPRLPLYLTYTSNWDYAHLAPFGYSYTHSAPFGYAWSLACEEQFYLLWPPILALLSTGRANWCMLLLLAANQAARHSWLDGVLPQPLILLLRSVQPAIVLGVLLAVALHSRRGYALLGPLFRRPAAPVVAFGLVIGLLSLGEELFSPLLLAASMAVAVGVCVVPARNAATPLLTFGPLRRIGVVSYGMYMFHQPVLTALRHVTALHPVLLFLVGGMATYVLAELSFRTFEKPFRRMKARFDRRVPAARVVAVDGGQNA